MGLSKVNRETFDKNSVYIHISLCFQPVAHQGAGAQSPFQEYLSRLFKIQRLI